MKKANRIKDSKEFTKTIKQGSFLKNNTYRLYWLENNLGYSRVGIAAGKKLGNAVIRSTIRRRIRAICDELIDYQSCSFDIVVMPKDTFLMQDHTKNKNDFESILQKLIGTKKWKEKQN